MRRRSAAATMLLLAVAGCGGSSGGSPPGGHTVTVFAASSLTDAFDAAQAPYKTQSGDDARFSFAGSQDLVAQIQQGAPADVVATADTASMDKVQDELAGDPQTLAHNELVIVTAKGNPHDIATLADLADPGLVVVLADPSVPAGSYAAQALDDANVTVEPKSLELDVRSVLTKVEVGEADAGIVYATDAKSAAGQVSSVPVEGAPTATYEIAPVTTDGQSFVDFMVSDEGQAILARYGFLPP